MSPNPLTPYRTPRKKPAIFLVEWVLVFTLAWCFWNVLLFKLQGSFPSLAAVGAISVFYSSAFVYLRLLKESGCKKCHSLLPFLCQEIGRRHVRDEELILEVEHGGEAWTRHYLDLYVRTYRVEIVRFRCRRCHAVWDETQSVRAPDNRLVRTIDLSK
jgi:hypothetical protein